ncbi:uncharacterized protein LOC128997557 [Macrosteles quadrilineatus]|uniref:uncharacterized protein LOC128997557 n=1 Tax=Macrosteles quadrilineatus TaxID=74068 RepID=UPI0023E2192A|nr:uncharacterized protein LOC128997557 [Macrosteles quadrilineatus]
MDELIKIQEEETSLVVSCAKAKAAAEKAAADERLARVEEEAKRKEIEMKKKLLEDRLSSLSRGSSRVSSRSSRTSISSLPRPLPTKEAVEKWMQTKDQAEDINKNNVFKPCTNVPVNIMKSVQQEVSLPHHEVQSSFQPREENCENPREARTVAFSEGRRIPRDVSCFPRDCQPDKMIFREKMPARILSALPNFSGDLDQWPAWIAEYRRSTEINDYTDLENLQRLQKCITGKAKEMISALLIYPENVPEIVNLLERRFGRPDIIIKNLIASVKGRPPTKDYKPDTLVAFSDMVRNLVVTVKSLKQDHYLFNPQLMEELTEKLSTNMKLNWGMFVTSPQSQLKQPIGLDSFSTWLSSVADAAIICTPSTSTSGNFKNMASRNESNSKNFVLVQHEGDKKFKKRICVCCKKQDHTLTECKQFLKYDVNKRWETVKSNSLCFNCLKTKHRAMTCRNKLACGVNGCTYFHNKLLHVTSKEEGANKETPKLEIHSEHMGFQEEPVARVLLRVLSVTLVGKNGKQIETFALIDDGSTISVIEKGLVEELEIDGPTKPVSFSWTDGSVYTEKESQTVTLTVIGDTGEHLTLNNVKTLTALQLPIQSMNSEQMKNKWSYLQEIPEEVFQRGRPRLLIGHEHVHLTVPLKVIIGPTNAPIALKSKLGWTINGPTGNVNYQTRIDNDFVMFKHETNSDMLELNTLVKESFERDFIDCPIKESNKSDEEVRAEKILENTCSQTEDGCWQTGLLWKEDKPWLPESRSVALKRFNYVENKMKEDPKLCQQYHQKIASYAEKGYAKKLNLDEVKNKSEKTWYLPHFPVYNPRKPDKFRFVFDAASKSHGKSLNSCLLPGPNLFNSLISILFQFRKHEIAYAADIEEMFLRIKIIPEDQDSLRFLWREETDGKLQEWCMTSMIFGAVCSPTSAIYITRKNSEKHGEEYPDAKLAVNQQFYMDDYLDSNQSVEEAKSLIEGVVNICKKGGFNLRNFISNSPELMSCLPKKSWSKNYLKEEDVGITTDDTERVLGIHWNFHEDFFLFKINFVKVKKEVVDLKEPPTKRQVLQAVMSIYDPIGFITPITMKGKILVQNLWKMNVQWDERIPAQLEKAWRNWMKDVKISENLKIPRCYNLTANCTVSLHIFCDASEKGFCSVAYFRTEKPEDCVEVVFVLARSRVAPLKSSTIPRLELQAAVLGSQIASLIYQFHKMEIDQTYFWTDSRIVWCWIQATQKQKSAYVANRVDKILSNSDRNQWRWLPTTENVADEATRESATPLTNDCRWLQGPSFLLKKEKEWPKIESIPRKEDCNEVALAILPENKENVIDMERFSKYSRLIRAVAWMQRFISNTRCKSERNTNVSLGVEELQRAEETCFRLSQLESFPKEMKNIEENKPVPRESRLHKLSPILTGNLLKMRGRTEYGNQISQDLKNPIILDPKHRLTVLLIQHEHEQAAHQGQETVANNLRQRFWVIRLKRAIKSCWANCKNCQLRRNTPKNPEMAPLPANRLEPYGRPFTCVAVDYFGPLEVTIGRRREKRYGVLFTCLSVRAVHLEIAASLNTDSAILAIRRFAARRGCPSELISDNGTNFKGAENELRKGLESFDNEQIKTFCVGKMMKWTFLPPASPHMGGAHERLIQSVKKCLRVILNTQAPKEETLTTLLCEVEYIINNRPLFPVSDDPNDELPLTPNHFLQGGADRVTPAVIITEKHLHRQWKIAQDMADKFWKRWLKEYVPLLNKRSKWHTKQANLQVGNLVLITDENQARGRWTKGVVEAVYPGRDGQVRVADIKTSTGTWRRPTAKLVKLMT